MMKSLSKPSRIDFEGIDMNQIQRILSSGDLSSLTEAERYYFDLMELVRGLRARIALPGNRIVTKAGIIKLLKSEKYGLSDWMARQVYTDAINFFYAEEGVQPMAWANLYADRLDKLASLAVASGKLKEARSFMVEAAKLRGCYKEQAPDIPDELLNPTRTVVYTGDAETLGAPRTDRRELEQFIDSIPEIPELARQRVKEDAGLKKPNLLQRLANDVKDFGDEDARG